MSRSGRTPIIPQEEDRVPARRILLAILAVLVISAAGVLWVQLIQPARHSRLITPAGTAGRTPVRLTPIAPDTSASTVPIGAASDSDRVGGDRGLEGIPIEQAMDIVAERGR